MGTSSSYGGPKDKNPLLPNDFEESGEANGSGDQDSTPPNKNQENPKTKLWQNAKTQFSKLIKDSNRNTKSTLSSYVKAYGGAKGAANTSVAGKSTTRQLGRLLSNISSNSVHETLKQYKINFEGRNVEDVLAEIINEIAPIPETKEDSIARNALLDALEVIYDKISENEDDLEALNDLDENAFNDIMQIYISSYIFQKLLNDLESRFEEHSSSSGSTLDLENEIKEYIVGVVENKTQNNQLTKLDYSSVETIKIIDEIYLGCYEVIEGVL